MFISNLLAHAIGLSMAMGEILAASKAFHGLTGSDSATSYVTLIARSNVLSSQNLVPTSQISLSPTGILTETFLVHTTASVLIESLLATTTPEPLTTVAPSMNDDLSIIVLVTKTVLPVQESISGLGKDLESLLSTSATDFQTLPISSINLTIAPVASIPTTSWVTVITGTLTETSTRWPSASPTTNTLASSSLSSTAEPTVLSTNRPLEQSEATLEVTLPMISSSTTTRESTTISSSSPTSTSNPNIQPTVQAPSSKVSSTSPASTVFAEVTFSKPTLIPAPISLTVGNPISNLTLSSTALLIQPSNQASSLSSPYNSTTQTTYPAVPALNSQPFSSGGNKRLSIPGSIRLPTIPEHVVSSAKSRWSHIGGKRLVIMTGVLLGMVVAGAIGCWLSVTLFGESE